ncbi:MAG: hypothetical protein KF878_13275 [Planctomycetes bacterium]|nr:hypothetical protein [Planctomycetota bacterium]
MSDRPKSVGASTNVSALAKPSELRPAPAGGATAVAAPDDRAHAADPHRPLPPVIRSVYRGGEQVQLTQDQLYADKVLVRRGERGRIMHQSSQAAAWVVWFPMMGDKLRVVPERLLQQVS